MANGLTQSLINYSKRESKPPAAGGKGVWGRSPQRLAILGDLLQK